MPQAASTRLAVIAPSGTDAISIGDDQIQAIVARLEAVGAGYFVSVAGSRPAVAASNNGFFHVATDTGVISFSTGTTWLGAKPAPGTVTATELATSVLNSFLGLASPASRKTAFGVGTFVGNGTTNAGSSISVAHGLGATPLCVASVSAPYSGSNWIGYCSVLTADASNLSIWPQSGGFTFTTSTVYGFYWMAIA